MLRISATALLMVGLVGSKLAACPFCNAVLPTFAERRAEAAAVVLGEARGPRAFQVVQVVAGREALGDRTLVEVGEADDAPPIAAGRLALLLGKRDEVRWSWEAIPVDEGSSAYFIRAPELKRPIAERLRYAARYLEHADPAVADDAFREFGRAPFDAVASVADVLPSARIREWLVDPGVPSERKGFYGLALGLAGDERLNRSLTYLLDRPATAAAALGDLTRRREWSLVDRAEKLFRASPGDDPALDRSVVGYLLVCPKPEASAAVRRLRGAEARRVADAEHYWSVLGIRGES
jgi:hypothetical protein